MRLSLRRLSLLRLCASTAAMLALAGGAYYVQTRIAGELASQSEQQSVSDAARHIELVLTHDQQTLARFARMPAVLAAMAIGADSERERLAHSLGGALPATVDLDLFSFDAGMADDPGLSLLDAQCRHLLNNAPTIPVRALHWAQETPAHFTLVQPVLDGGVVRGVVFARLSADWVRDVIADTLPKGGYMELLPNRRAESASTLGAVGDASRRGTRAPLTARVADAGFEVAYWPPANSGDIPANWKRLFFAAVLVAFAGLAVSTLIVDAVTRRAVRHDMKSIARMMKDIREGMLRVDYPIRLKEFRTLLRYLGKSGGKLVRERRRLKDLGLTDHLSRLPNRRAFEVKLEQMYVQSRVGFPSSLLLIDIDRFKRINDDHGHDAGDALITGFAQALRDRVRETDYVARLAGDEFCIIFPFTDQHTAEVLAERLRLRMPAEIDLGTGVHQRVAWTGGLSVMHRADTKFDDVLWRADKALFGAKAAGRNRTHVYQPDMPASRLA